LAGALIKYKGCIMNNINNNKFRALKTQVFQPIKLTLPASNPLSLQCFYFLEKKGTTKTPLENGDFQGNKLNQK